MERIDLDADALAEALETLPVSTIAGLLTPCQEWKARAARAMACDLIDRLRGPVAHDANQLALNIG